MKLAERLGIAEEPLAWIADYWEALREDDHPIPRRGKVDPLAIPARILPHVMLIDVEDGGRRYRYRLVGSKIESDQGYAMTGKSFEEMLKGSLLRRTIDRYNDVALTPAVNYHVTTPLLPGSAYHIGGSNNVMMTFARVLLPLRGDGDAVSTILGCRVRLDGGSPWRSYEEQRSGKDVTTGETIRREVIPVKAGRAAAPERSWVRNPFKAWKR